MTMVNLLSKKSRAEHLQQEASSRQYHGTLKRFACTVNRQPFLQSWRYPGPGCMDFIKLMLKPDSGINTQYTATIEKVISDGIRRYQGKAASRLKLVTGPETQREKDRAGECEPNRARPKLAGSQADAHELPAVISPSEPQPQPESSGPGSVREAFVMPILTAKGWSIYDWATNAGVDFHTANDYLKGQTKPYPSTRKKLADSLGVDVGVLPA